MKPQDFSITELEQETGTSRRTIHFYVKEGLIPPPNGKGGGAKYDRGHLVRLNLIRQMQKSHLKLSGIRQAIEAVSLEEMQKLAERAEASSHASVPSLDAFDNWLAGRKPESEQTPLVLNVCEPALGSYSFAEMAREPRKASRLASEKPVASPAPGCQLSASNADTAGTQWKRIVVQDGVEIHVRSDARVEDPGLITRIANALEAKS